MMLTYRHSNDFGELFGLPTAAQYLHRVRNTSSTLLDIEFGRSANCLHVQRAEPDT